MSIVEMQPAALPSSFPVSDTRPSLPVAYSAHSYPQAPYLESRQSSKENKTPPPAERTGEYQSASPQPSPAHQAVIGGSKHASAQHSPQHAVAGKKRSANGRVKEKDFVVQEASKLTNTGHSRNTSTLSNSSSANMAELSQQLRTRLTYAMVKLQNGWQDRSLDEVESLASQSPRSTTFNHLSENRHLLSPRVAMSAHLNRHNSSSSSDSDHSHIQQPLAAPGLMSPPSSRRALAPPANIVSRSTQQRRRPTPNMQVHTGAKPVTRPTVTQRTPSQNAAMEADAVETLLFMASPNNSGHASSQFSPVTSAPSVRHFHSQTSPLRNTFSVPVSPKRVAFSSHHDYAAEDRQSKDAIIDSMVERLDADGSADLEEALKLMDRHHSTKVTT